MEAAFLFRLTIAVEAGLQATDRAGFQLFASGSKKKFYHSLSLLFQSNPTERRLIMAATARILCFMCICLLAFPGISQAQAGPAMTPERNVLGLQRMSESVVVNSGADATLRSLLGEGTTVIPYDERLFMRTGNGFDLASYSARLTSPLVDGQLESEASGPTLDFSIRVVAGTQSVADSSTITAAAEARYLVAKGNLDATLKKLSNLESQSVSVELNYMIRYLPQLRRPLVLKKQFANSVGTPAFSALYGTHAIAGVTSRSALVLRFATSNLSKTEASDLIIKVSASFDSGLVAGASINTQLNEVSNSLAKRSQGTMQIFAEGISDGQELALTAPNPSTDLGTWAFQAFSALQKLKKTPRFDQAVLVPYESLPVEDAPLPGSVTKTYFSSASAARLYSMVREWQIKLNVIEEMTRTPAAYGYISVTNIKALTSALPRVQEFLRRLKENLQKVNIPDQKIPEVSVPEDLVALRWPSLAFYPIQTPPDFCTGPSPAQIFCFRRVQFLAMGGTFRYLRLTALPGSSSSPGYARVVYDLYDRRYRSGYVRGPDGSVGTAEPGFYGQRLISNEFNESSLIFTLTLGRADLGARGPFLIELVSDDQQHVFGSYMVNP